MLLCDTHVLLFDALQPGKIPPAARDVLEAADAAGQLACADISLWEIAMLVEKDRVTVAVPVQDFLDALLMARGIAVLPITVQIAALSASERLPPGDPADRLIAATALVHGAKLLSGDARLQNIAGLETVWSG